MWWRTVSYILAGNDVSCQEYLRSKEPKFGLEAGHKAGNWQRWSSRNISTEHRENERWGRVAAIHLCLVVKPHQQIAVALGAQKWRPELRAWGGCRNCSRPLDASFGPLLGLQEGLAQPGLSEVCWDRGALHLSAAGSVNVILGFSCLCVVFFFKLKLN